MKRIYWRPRAVSRTALALIALLSVSGLLLVENLKTSAQRPYHDEKLEVARLAKKSLEVLRQYREDHDISIDPVTDPLDTGLIGLSMSPVTSSGGNLAAKRTAVNPNFAAVIVEMLKKAGVRERDVVAVGVSGSFPGLNVAAYAALEAMNVKPIVIASAASSQWGANLPELLWLDMENVLYREKVFSFRSAAASMGGYEDRGLGMSDEGKQLLLAGIRRNKLPLIKGDSFDDMVAGRMKIYRQFAAGAPIRAYINVGGGVVSTGRYEGRRMFRSGLNTRPRLSGRHIDGVMPRLARDGVPVLHLVHIIDLAERYGLPFDPETMPQVGEGNVFHGKGYNRLLAVGVLLAIAIGFYGLIHSNLGFHLLHRKDGAGPPEPMV